MDGLLRAAVQCPRVKTPLKWSTGNRAGELDCSSLGGTVLSGPHSQNSTGTDKVRPPRRDNRLRTGLSSIQVHNCHQPVDREGYKVDPITITLLAADAAAAVFAFAGPMPKPWEKIPSSSVLQRITSGCHRLFRTTGKSALMHIELVWPTNRQATFNTCESKHTSRRYAIWGSSASCTLSAKSSSRIGHCS